MVRMLSYSGMLLHNREKEINFVHVLKRVVIMKKGIAPFLYIAGFRDIWKCNRFDTKYLTA